MNLSREVYFVKDANQMAKVLLISDVRQAIKEEADLIIQVKTGSLSFMDFERKREEIFGKNLTTHKVNNNSIPLEQHENSNSMLSEQHAQNKNEHANKSEEKK